MIAVPTAAASDPLAPLVLARERQAAGVPVWAWFDRKLRGHMEATGALGGRRIPPETTAEHLLQVFEKPAQRSRVIYVHIPYCSRICSFCSFFRQPLGSADLEAYVQAVLTQIARIATAPWVRHGPAFEAIYFGGGTPTVLAPRQLGRLLGALQRALPIATEAEITCECRCADVTPEGLRELHAAGFNRLSFGVQSFDTAVRRAVGRIATGAQIRERLDQAAGQGFANVSVDLIYNLPGQTLAHWEADLQHAMAAPITGVSAYALIPMRGSQLVRQIAAGRAQPLGDLAHEYALWQRACAVLASRPDWRRLSFQHFGQIARERNRYNAVRSGQSDILGLGAGAGGQVGETMIINPMDIAAYLAHQQPPTIPDPEPVLAAYAGAMLFEGHEQHRPGRQANRLVEGPGLSRRQLLAALPGFDATLAELLALDLVRADASDHLTLSSDGCFWGYNLTALLTGAILAQAPAP